MERRIWKTAPPTRSLVFGGAVGEEVSRGAFEEKCENFKEYAAEGEYVCFLGVVFGAIVRRGSGVRS